MRKFSTGVISVTVGLMIAGIVWASNSFGPAIHGTVNSGSASTISIAYTNNLSSGAYLTLQSAWLQGANVTNGTVKIITANAVTNSPAGVTFQNATLEYMPLGGLPIEPNGIVLFTGTCSATNSSATYSIYVTE
jgi:hypothetical protein